jgi:hypothetical protein
VRPCGSQLLSLVAFLVATGSAVLFALFPALIQAWSRGALARVPWLRAFRFAFDDAMTNPRRAWVLRIYGLSLLPFAALAANAVVAGLATP